MRKTAPRSEACSSIVITMSVFADKKGNRPPAMSVDLAFRRAVDCC
jgi:hypothetical protein